MKYSTAYFKNTVFPEISETRQDVSVAYWLLLTNTGLKLRPQVSSIDVEICFSKTVL